MDLGKLKHSLEFDFIITGIGIQNPYSGEIFSLSKKDVEFRGKILKNSLHFKYCIDVDREPSLQEQEYINRVVVKERDIFLQMLTLVLARPSHILSHQAKLDDKIVEPRFPPQKIPSGLYNLISFWNLPNINHHFTSVIHDDGWPLLEALIKKLRQEYSSIHNELALPLRWFLKGSNETNSLDRLVAFWISFNALYEDKSMSERTAIEQYVDDNTDQVIAQRFFKQNGKRLISLSKFPIELRGDWKVAQELMMAVNSYPLNYENIVRLTIFTIYGVRNSLFHGDCDPNSNDDRVMIEYSERLFSRLLQEYIAKKILDKPLPHRRFVIQEKFGI